MKWMFALVGSVTVIVVVAVVALTVATRSSSTAVADLEVGDCFDLPTPDPDAGDQGVEVVQQLDVIDCDAPHQAEVVLVGELNPHGDLEYPVDEVLFEMVDQRCVAVAGLVAPDFGLLPIAPIEATWEQLGGRFHCVALSVGGADTVGTLSVGGGSD